MGKPSLFFLCLLIIPDPIIDTFWEEEPSLPTSITVLLCKIFKASQDQKPLYLGFSMKYQLKICLPGKEG